MSALGGYAVDLAELDAVVADLGRLHAALLDAAATIDVDLRPLRATWHGVGAAAHAQAHARWRQGLVELHDALADLRAAARAAHTAYDAAVADGVRLWEGLA